MLFQLIDGTLIDIKGLVRTDRKSFKNLDRIRHDLNWLKYLKKVGNRWVNYFFPLGPQVSLVVIVKQVQNLFKKEAVINKDLLKV